MRRSPLAQSRATRHSAVMPNAPYSSQALSALSIAELAELIRFHDAAYWRDNAPQIPDQVFDQLVERLRKKAPGHPVLGEIGGGANALGAGEKVDHEVPMLSLGKCYSELELLHWAREHPGTLVASPKVDGAACSIRYDAHGRFLLAATRGDGRRGESIGHNVKQIPTVPTRLPAELVQRYGTTVEVRGEVYLPLSAFEVVSELFANPRNVAAGALKAKEQGGVPASELRFFAYDTIGWDVPSETAKEALLKQMGFTPAETFSCQREGAQAVYDQISAARAHYDYETDGVVFKIDDIETQRLLGSTSHHPRWAIAYKFQGDSGETTLERVEWSLARTGTITPVAIVAPVSLSGAMVSRATLHNVSNLQRLALKVGDRLQLTRRGGVIPHVEGNLGGGAELVALPARCPSCDERAEVRESTRRQGGEDIVTRTLHCTVPSECPATLRGQLFHYTRVLDIDGFGAKILNQLLKRGIVRDAAGLYDLTVERLLELERMGATLAEKLVANVHARAEVPLEKFLVALGIETLGKHAAGLLSARWTLPELRQQTVESLAEIPSLGTLTAEQIVAGLVEQGPLMDRLLQHVTIAVPAEPTTEGALTGQVVVFTGKLVQMNRSEAQKLVVRLGGAAGSSVTKQTTLVVVGGDGLVAEKPSSKLKRALKLKEAGQALELISEADFHGRVAEVSP